MVDRDSLDLDLSALTAELRALNRTTSASYAQGQIAGISKLDELYQAMKLADELQHSLRALYYRSAPYSRRARY